jgi:hypothetical protein
VVAYDWVEEQTPPTEDEATRFGARGPIGAAWPDDPIYAALRTAGTSRV